MKFVVEIADRYTDRLQLEVDYLERGGTIWITAFADTEPVPILAIEAIP
jgi:hypothetical protein